MSPREVTPVAPVRRRAARLRRRARASCATVAGAALLPLATGCYSYRTVPSDAVSPGMPISLGITDRGRVALGEQVGPGALRIEGTLVDRTDSLYVLRVSEVDYLDGRSNRWSGETVRVPRDFVGTVGERNFSRARTWLAAGAVTAITAAAIVAITLTVSGTDDGGTRVPPPPEGQ